jgi:hypothetical protein
MTELINKVKEYSHAKRIERLIEIGIKQMNGSICPQDAMEIELIQAIRSENGEIAQVKKMRELTDKMDAIEDNKPQSRADYNKHFEDDGAYADD